MCGFEWERHTGNLEGTDHFLPDLEPILGNFTQQPVVSVCPLTLTCDSEQYISCCRLRYHSQSVHGSTLFCAVGQNVFFNF